MHGSTGTYVQARLPCSLKPMASSVSPAVLLCFQCKASANADSAKRRTSMSIDKAESLIISGLFTSAAREAQNVLEAPDPKSDVKLRAAYVLLQSLYELNRSPSPSSAHLSSGRSSWARPVKGC